MLVASAVGYYGHQGDQPCDESTPPGDDFLARICQEWEQASEPAESAGIRVLRLRLGVVLSIREGALAKMLPIFRLGLGGKLGSGNQWWAWVHLTDAARAFEHAMLNAQLSGAVNVVAPQPKTNAQFTKTLGRVLGRPTCLPAPKPALRLAMGEMADHLLLKSCHALPKALLEDGFDFAFPELEPALRDLLGR
jgi:uncharacterized protein (TIGR01777 family)